LILSETGAQDLSDGRKAILTVDAVAFRSAVTITGNGEVKHLKHLKQLDNDDLFAPFLRNPKAFAEFLQQHWKDAYSDLFVFHIQPVNHAFPCTVIHVYSAENGKGNQITVQTLQQLRNILETQYQFQVVGLAFDGDSCFNGLHDDFASRWTRYLSNDPTHVPRFPDTWVMISDPLHLLKRIRYRFVIGFHIDSTEERITFSIDQIRSAGHLSPILFDDSRASKMHDSLPLEMFSYRTLKWVAHDGDGAEIMIVRWRILVVALTFHDLSTRTCVELLEIGFWMLCRYANPPPVRGGADDSEIHAWLPRRAANEKDSFDMNAQIRDAMNTFMALMILIRHADGPFCLNRRGSNP
jgi:hypothetical protein